MALPKYQMYKRKSNLGKCHMDDVPRNAFLNFSGHNQNTTRNREMGISIHVQ